MKIFIWLFKNPGNQISSKIIHGSIWTFITQIFTRTLTFIRTIILARLLSPTDFGLMGIAFLGLSTLQTFSETGVNAALIYKKKNSREELNVAWSLRLLRSLVITILLFLGAPYIASFFNNLKATNIIRAIALAQLFFGLSNIAIVRLQKEIEFHKYFLFSICSTIPEVIVAISMALIFKSVWALVLGYLTGAIANCIFSYIFCPFKPTFSLSGIHVKSLLGYGKWIWASSIIIFLITQGDDIFVGKVLGATALGLYQLAYRISNLPATEISHAISRVAFPAYVKLRESKHKLGKTYLDFLKTTIILCFSFSFLIIGLSQSFINDILGKKWAEITLPLQILCIFACLRSIGATNGTFFRAIGCPDIETKLSLLKLLLLITMIYPLSIKYGITGVALATTIPSFIHNFIGTYFIIKKFDITYNSILRILIFSLTISLLCMLFSRLSLSTFYSHFELSSFYNLTLSTFIGVFPLIFAIILLRKGKTQWISL